jgi:hypothetical protein
MKIYYRGLDTVYLTAEFRTSTSDELVNPATSIGCFIYNPRKAAISAGAATSLATGKYSGTWTPLVTDVLGVYTYFFRGSDAGTYSLATGQFLLAAPPSTATST